MTRAGTCAGLQRRNDWTGTPRGARLASGVRSRETLTVSDAPASPVADDALELVLVESQRLGFLGPGPVMFHVEHAHGFLEPMGTPPPTAFLDLGSGGGVPGLVLAHLLVDSTAVLLDAMVRRCRFLEWAVQELGLQDRVTVECGRAEELGRRPELRGHFPVVVTRSFGPPAVTAECAAAFVQSPGGRVLVSEPPDPDAQRWSTDGLARLGLAIGSRAQTATATVQTLRSVEALDERYPRRTGVPDKRPLF